MLPKINTFIYKELGKDYIEEDGNKIYLGNNGLSKEI